MKKTSILALGAAILLTSCGMLAGTSSSDSGHRFSDGIYSSAPSFVTKEERAEAKAENQALVSKTKESAIYLFSDKKDTIIIPENFSAKIQFDPKVGGTTVTVGENPYDWRWDLENRYGYWYGPYSIGASWYWSRHYSPYWSPYWCGWSYSPWRYYSFYDPWYCGGFYDPWYYGGFYDPWYYGGYWGWHDPWHHYHHHGWYDPHYHRPVGGPSHSGGHGGFRREYASRVRTERTGSYAGAVAGRERTADKSIYNRTAGGGTIRGGSSEGNRISRAASTGRSSVSTGRSSSSTGRSSVSASRPAAARPSAGRGTQSPSYRRPSSAVSSGSAAASSDYRRDKRSYDSDRSSGYSRSSSSSGSYSRSSSYSSPSYSRSSSSSSGGYSRSSSSGGYSRSSSGGYRR